MLSTRGVAMDASGVVMGVGGWVWGVAPGLHALSATRRRVLRTRMHCIRLVNSFIHSTASVCDSALTSLRSPACSPAPLPRPAGMMLPHPAPPL